MRMTSELAHRGPDDSGHWHDQERGIALGHRRLSIVDLSPTGHQPMTSASGRYVMVLNGEFYNYGALRDELSRLGAQFRGASDTEVVLTGCDRWGVQRTIEKVVGMFAIALWDRDESALYLIRDRIGEKPLYYAHVNGTLLFGSELKSLVAHPHWSSEIDRDSVAAYLRHSFIPGNRTIYTRTSKVAPGTMLRFIEASPAPQLIQYWSAERAAIEGRAHSLPDNESEVASLLDAALRRTLREEMIADVALGAFLSGGIDSSLVVALMQAESGRPVRTFTIGFEDPRFNEAVHAREVAAHLGTDHTEFVVTEQDARDIVPLLPRLYDEPFADSSQIPTHLVSALARQHVTVALSGDGGDELFGGYGRYTEAECLWKRIGGLPLAVRRATAMTLGTVPDAVWRSIVALGAPGSKIARANPTPERVAKLARVLSAADPSLLYREMLTQWSDASSVVLGARVNGVGAPRIPGGLQLVEQLMFADMTGYLVDDIMVKVDRAAMGVSLESRAPYLDHRIVEFAWRIPLSLKVRNGKGKWILRTLLDRYVPNRLTDRPKMGFGVPLDAWLRGPLRAWADDLLDPSRLRREGIFDAKSIASLWRRHRSGAHVSGHLIWSLVMFQAWLDSVSGGSATTEEPSARSGRVVSRQLMGR